MTFSNEQTSQLCPQATSHPVPGAYKTIKTPDTLHLGSGDWA